ncbi:MAG: glycerate kinase [Syntrophus sp. (in: bacteria)]|nr:glycerate kinase [Syntrophus sp. (in: bacteria)]
MNTKETVTEIFNDALHAVDPYESVKSHGEALISSYHGGKFKRMSLIGFGKAAVLMAKAMADYAGDIITNGVVITKYGHSKGLTLLDSIRVHEAGHPVPDIQGYTATLEVIKIAKEVDEQTLTVCIISGGGSALLVAPYGEITLSEKQVMTRLLLNGGADIHEMNTARKHISLVKGGRLAELARSGKTVSLILSDVIGDRLDVIASGPTAPDQSTYGDAYGVISKYDLEDKAPQSVLHVLREGMEGRMPETPDETNPVFERVENIIVGNNSKATEAAYRKAVSLGFDTTLISSEIQGEARGVARLLAEKVKEIKGVIDKNSHRRICLISGGETTVKVTGSGIGGRNMELALAFAIEVEGIEGITFLSAGTDGTDGPTDAAGAIVDGSTPAKGRAKGIDPFQYLNNNDSYSFFKEIDGLFVTGATGTNVMDLQIIIIEPPKA